MPFWEAVGAYIDSSNAEKQGRATAIFEIDAVFTAPVIASTNLIVDCWPAKLEKMTKYFRAMGSPAR